MFWPEEYKHIRHATPSEDGSCINEDCWGKRRDIVQDTPNGTCLCQICGTVQYKHQSIVYDEEKRSFGQDKDGDKGVDNRRTSVVHATLDLSKLAKPLQAAAPDAEMPAQTAFVTTEDEDEEGGEDDRIKWKLKTPVMNWGLSRRSQIGEGLRVLCDNGFVSFDQVQEGLQELDLCIRAVVHNESAWHSHYMANSAFWTCVFAMRLKERELGEWVVRGRCVADVDEARSKWTMENMHAVLVGDRSKGFRSEGGGDGAYLTKVGANSGRKHGFGSAVLRDDLKKRKFDVRNLGTNEMQLKKVQSLNAILVAAGLAPLSAPILALQEPSRHIFTAPTSARAKAELAAASRFQNTSGQTRKSAFLKSRAIFVKPTPKTKPRVSDFVPMGQHDDDVIPGIEELYTDSERCQWHKKQLTSKFLRAPSPGADLVPSEAVQIPSEGEEDPEEKKQSLMNAALGLAPKQLFAQPISAAPVAADPVAELKRRQGEQLAALQREQQEQLEALQANQDGAVFREQAYESSDFSDDEAFFAANQIQVADVAVQDQVKAAAAAKPDLPPAVVARMKRINKAKQKQRDGIELTKCDVADLDWWSRVDVKRLEEHGEVVAVAKPREVSWETRVKRIREEREKTERREQRRAQRDMREHEKRLKEAERKGVAQERLLAHEAADKAKADRRAKRDHDRIERSNAKLNSAIQKKRDTEQERIQKKRGEAFAKLERAEKNNRTACALMPGFGGELKLKIHMPTRSLPKPKQQLPCDNTYATFFSNSRFAEHKGITALPLPNSLPGDCVRINLQTRPGLREGTRAHKRKSDEGAE